MEETEITQLDLDFTQPTKAEKDIEQFSVEDLQQLLDNLISEAVSKARDDFYVYVKIMAPVILPEGFIDGKHIQLMCKELEKVEASVEAKDPIRFQLFLPPGSMKSKLLNLFVTWCLGRHPKWNILHIGHSTSFAEDNFGRQIRDVIKSPEYGSIFPDTKVRSDVRASGRWSTTQGGQYYATGVGTRIAGRRAHISICDDVISEQTAYSKLERDKINKWYVPGLQSRLLPNGAEVIVNTRWHLEDLSGYLVKIDSTSRRPWNIISIPALLDKKSADLLGLKEGESFWPEFWTTDVLMEKKDSDGMTKQTWASLYMQSPVAEEGNIIKEEDCLFWDSETPPKVSYVLISMDTAFSTSNSADYSAITVWGIFKQKFTNHKGDEEMISCMILLDAEKGRWDFSDLCNKTVEYNRAYFPDSIIIEKRASGQSLLQEMRRRALPVREYIPERDKVTRLHASTPFFEAGRVFFPQRKWAEEVINELTLFPHVQHDDYTDTVSQAILWMRDSYVLGNDGYSVDEEDEDDGFSQRKTYWSKLVNSAA